MLDHAVLMSAAPPARWGRPYPFPTPIRGELDLGYYNFPAPKGNQHRFLPASVPSRVVQCFVIILQSCMLLLTVPY